MMDDGWVICTIPIEPEIPRRVAVMARWLARKAVIEQLRVRGLNPTPAVMREQTEAYLRQHWRTLIYQAQTVLKTYEI